MVQLESMIGNEVPSKGQLALMMTITLYYFFIELLFSINCMIPLVKCTRKNWNMPSVDVVILK